MTTEERRNKAIEFYSKILTVDPYVEMKLKDGSKIKVEFDLKVRRDFYRNHQLDICKGEDQSKIVEDMDLMLELITMGAQVHDSSITKERIEDGIALRQLTYYIFMLRMAFEVSTPDIEVLRRVLSGEEKGEKEATPLASTSDSPSSGPMLELS